jgi:seryl-tRNA synthetase
MEGKMKVFQLQFDGGKVDCRLLDELEELQKRVERTEKRNEENKRKIKQIYEKIKNGEANMCENCLREKQKYICKHCGKIIERESDKKRINSYCVKKQKKVRLIKLGNGNEIVMNDADEKIKGI